jgi:FkbM family methyltransferase
MAGFRRFKRQYLPFLVSGAQVRQWRNRLLRKVGLSRAYEPALLTKCPDLRYGTMLPLFVAEHVLEHGSLTFLQIGAYDGQVGDALLDIIRRFPVRGVLVEPQPTAFARLQELHKNRDNLLLVNAAIDRETCRRPFFMSKNNDVQFASFDRSHLVKHGLRAEDIVSREVDCLTVGDVLNIANFDTVDLLQIDAEGYDYEILKSIDFDRSRPKIIRFEYRHFSEPDLNECLQMLAERGYRILAEKLDLIAVLAEATTVDLDTHACETLLAC